MRIFNIKKVDYFNKICSQAKTRFEEIPEPIIWIEPSINMLYLDSMSSFVFGNFFSSIITMGILLEHILRLAIYDKENTGLNRNVSIEELDKLGTIRKLIIKANDTGLIEDEDMNWWEQVGKVIRNKSAHYIIPYILKEFTKEEYSENQSVCDHYHPEYYKFTDKEGNPESHIAHDWGSFFHKSDYFICRAFLNDSTLHINKIISKTNWKPDRSWWKSQEELYNMFFEYGWDFEDMKRSLDKYYTPLKEE